MPEEVLFNRFDGGVNIDIVPERLPQNTLPFLRNATLRRGSIESRKGFSRRISLLSPLTSVSLFHRAVLPNGEFFFVGYNDGTNWKIAVWKPGDTTWTILGNVNGRPLDAVTYKGYVYIATEQSMLKSNGSVLYNWGIAPPTTAPTAQAGTSGNLVGTYQWKVTFVRQEGNYFVESNSSPASTPLTLNNQRANLTIPTSSDPQVNRRRIYRTGGTRSDWKLVGEILDNTTTTFTDNTPDNYLTLQPSLYDYKDRPPVASIIAVHRERLFLVERARPTRLWFSSYGEPEYFPPTPPSDDNYSGSWVEVGALDGQDITALAPVGTALAIFKTGSIYMLLGELLNEITIRRVASIGVPHLRAVAQTGVATFFHDGNHLYLFTGDQVQNVSQYRFSSLFRTTSPSNVDLVFDPQEGILWIIVKAGSNAGLHRYDLVNNIYEGFWTVNATLYFALADDPSKGRGLWLLTSQGILQYDINANTDWDGSNVSWTVQFPNIVNPAEFWKRVHAFKLTGSLPTVQWNIAAKGTWTNSVTANAKALRRYAPDNLIGETISSQITCTGQGRIDEFALEIQPLRRVSV